MLWMHPRERDRATAPPEREEPPAPAPPVPGRRTLVDSELARWHDFEAELIADAPEADRGGDALPDDLLRSMSQAFGADFSDVRVYQGAQAAALDVAAYARGDELHFAPGHYDPHSAAGRALIGHELAHVVQQRAGRVAAPSRDGEVHVDPALEAEATYLGERAARGLRVVLGGGFRARPGAIQADNFKGKTKQQKKLAPFHDKTVTFERAANDENTIAKPITAKDIQGKLGNGAPEFTFFGNLNKIGHHTITFSGNPKVVINVHVNLPAAVVLERQQAAEARDVAHEKDHRYDRTPDDAAIPEPAPSPARDAPASAQFGTEFTFSNPLMMEQARGLSEGGRQEKACGENLAKQKAWKLAMVDAAPPGLKFIEDTKDKDGYPSLKFTYDDGWWYCCSLDVACIETQTYKMSLEDARARGWLDRVQRDIFNIAAGLGLVADKTAGGGHLHLDLQTTFGGNYQLFRNFLVDFANNPLALEALENDPTNAPVLGQLDEHLRTEFKRVIRLYDNKVAEGHIQGVDAIVQLANAVQNKVYRNLQFDEPEKYQAVNLTRTVNPTVDLPDKTVEIRALRAQRSAAEFVQIAQLFQARIEMLKHEPDLAYDDAQVRGSGHSDPKAVLDAFRQYVEQAGLAFSDYQAMVESNLAERRK